MDIFDNKIINPAKEKSDYKFVGGDIKAFLQDFKEEKQVFQNEDEADDLAQFEALNEQATQEQETADAPKITASAASSTAKIAVTTLDSILSETLRYIAKAETADDFKADSESRKELERAISEYIKVKGISNLPPSTMILILIVVIYGTKIPNALQLRKANEKMKEQEQELQRLRAKLELMEARHIVEDIQETSEEDDNE